MKTNAFPFPHMIALCGAPKSGKSAVQEILARHGVEAVDDGRPLREFAIEFLGLERRQAYTQEGKLEIVELAGRVYTARDILGRFGNALEDQFGNQIMQSMSCRSLDLARSYSFGSVRRDQGAFYKARGGVVLEIIRPGIEPSPYEFDRYDRSLVDLFIHNDGSLAELEDQVLRALRNWNELREVAADLKAAA